MIISHFNRFMARHGRTAFIVIGIIIIFPFVFLWRLPGRAFSRRTEEEDVGRMYGKSIPREDFMRCLRASDLTVFIQTNGYLLPSRNNRFYGYWVQDALRRMRTLREARKRGLDRVSDLEVAEYIRKMPMFQKDGAFDPERFRQFCNGMLKSQQMTPAEFDDVVRQNIITQRIEDEIKATVFVSPAEVRQAFDRAREKFEISRSDFYYYKFMKEASIDPTAEEIEAYFKAHRKKLKLPERKRIRVAIFDLADYTAKAKVTEEQAKAYYKQNAARYKREKKTFDAVKNEILKMLREREGRKLAMAAARKLRERLKAEKGKAKAIAETMKELCDKEQVKTIDSGPFTDKTPEIPGLGKLLNLRRLGYRLTSEAPVSTVIYDSGRQYVACWLDSKPGPIPTKLDDETKALVKEDLLRDKAREFYEKHVEKFRGRLIDGKTPQDLVRDYAKEIDKMSDKSDEEKKELRDAFDNEISRYLSPYFVPEKKKVAVVSFAPARFVRKVKVTDDDIRRYYEENKAEYKREEIRGRRILLRFPPRAGDKQKQAVRSRIEKIRAEIAAGRDFAEAARQYSQDTATRTKGGDTGFFARGTEPPEVDSVVFALEPGEISDVIETKTGCILFKLEKRRDERPLADAREEIRKKIIEEKSDALAREAASDFADKVYALLEKSSKKPAAEVFADAAKAQHLAVKESGWFRQGGYIPPFGFEADLAKQAFALSEVRPLSDPVKGKKEYYVACWQGTQAAYLPKFDKEPGLESRVRNQLLREAALRLARRKAREAHDAIQAKLDKGYLFEKASEGYQFTDVPSFTLDKPPRQGADNQRIVEELPAYPARSLLPPIETTSGSVLVYLKTRERPSDADFEKEKDSFRKQLRRRKEGEAVSRFRKRLEDESNTHLVKRWQPRDT
ncbi:MAG: hypothetical protein GXP31_01250 [Kiritimatiellaeota bacterium]|nr:hypothetical protein [Kiritimatiellota bacterium]